MVLRWVFFFFRIWINWGLGSREEWFSFIDNFWNLERVIGWLGEKNLIFSTFLYSYSFWNLEVSDKSRWLGSREEWFNFLDFEWIGWREKNRNKCYSKFLTSYFLQRINAQLNGSKEELSYNIISYNNQTIKQLFNTNKFNRRIN